MSAPVGPDAMNCRPWRPSSSQCTSDAPLPVLARSAGGAISGSISASSCWKELSAARSANLKITPFAADQNSASATSPPRALAIGRVRKYCSHRESTRKVSRNSRARRTRAMNMSTAIRPSLTGSALSMGSRPMMCRTVFCQCAACHRNTAAAAIETIAAAIFNVRARRTVGSGSSKKDQSQRRDTPAA